ncbi:MAG: HNH endonuclease [Magnetococcales bacterium]|nr:HNH endonuclease [Magnetococcales bacterium]
MRPICRGQAPYPDDYAHYQDAKPDLVARLGPYCSFCERRIATQLAVEHVQPKGRPEYAALIGHWNNFLLACVNSNSIKKDKDVDPAKLLLPDRDNTFVAFEYLPDGTIQPSELANAKGLGDIAEDTLGLTGLDKGVLKSPDAKGRQVALDRVSQRKETWIIAEEARNDLEKSPGNPSLQDYIVKLAEKTGFFSVWMTVFREHADMLRHLVLGFVGTAESGCFDAQGGAVSPAANPDGLAGGGKI